MKTDPEYPEEYYEHLARILGEEQAAWARLPREEREKELRWLHQNFNTPDDLSVWPPEMGGDEYNVPSEGSNS
jgi:hypothetical protein